MHIQRCGWCTSDPIYMAYHDQEWGQAVYDEKTLFEMLCLEGQQAGLSWITVLKKRDCYRAHFFQYSIAEIAAFSDAELAEKCQDAGLIRHLGKLTAIRDNAQAWLRLKQQQIDVVKWLWAFAAQPKLNNNVPHYADAAAQSAESQRMSKTLKKMGFKFVGPTICYAFMQAVGMVDDHENHCTFKTPPLPSDKS
ncbi:DNA-3-methyladenine glycosidase [Acinetobacter sp. NCu2D-2]|uniref:DNA-3-methyladenine glycosylase I n=1 Tax=Acinetobacter sp. NCu2D-2 TaxID=1608473 RepID=UPI0007CDBB38|nr:DNA-3-methyladenine glycosylase I [Acinetobacter sp. NCu2D-2]ANF82917.1 DNA-3-methyladenine glycosidase [Acinetobacter sp. NCu2D-2]